MHLIICDRLCEKFEYKRNVELIVNIPPYNSHSLPMLSDAPANILASADFPTPLSPSRTTVKGPTEDGVGDSVERAESEEADEQELDRDIPMSECAKPSLSSCPPSVPQMLHRCR